MEKYWSEVFKNFGIGLMVASVVLRISEKVSFEASLIAFLAGLTNVVIGFILLKVEGSDDE